MTITKKINPEKDKIVLSDFSLRHWDKNFTGTRITNYSAEDFLEEFNFLLKKYGNSAENEVRIIDGYADFCKLISIPNFTNARTGTLPITIENYVYLRSGYHSRNKKELPVLSRWLDLPIPPPTAKYLIIVVYSREQLMNEKLAESGDSVPICFKTFLDGADWGIVSIMGQMDWEEEPMKPITMMRNSLGLQEGGSGVSIDREKYIKSVEFWKTHATVKS